MPGAGHGFHTTNLAQPVPAPYVSGMIRALFIALLLLATPASAKSITILALGDSLTAGYGLDPQQAFPVKLEAALKAEGQDVRVLNAGVSGDTSAAALSRLDWALGDGADAAIVELGANDALRGLSPTQTEEALTAILSRLQSAKIPIVLAGMKAPRNLGADYDRKFDAIYPRLAAKYDVLFYPFFLEGVAADAKLNQPDGMHPNAAGVDKIVNGMLPIVKALIVKSASK